MTTDREYIVEAAEKVRNGTPLRRFSPTTITGAGFCAQLVREVSRPAASPALVLMALDGRIGVGNGAHGAAMKAMRAAKRPQIDYFVLNTVRRGNDEAPTYLLKSTCRVLPPNHLCYPLSDGFRRMLTPFSIALANFLALSFTHGGTIAGYFGHSLSRLKRVLPPPASMAFSLSQLLIWAGDTWATITMICQFSAQHSHITNPEAFCFRPIFTWNIFKQDDLRAKIFIQQTANPDGGMCDFAGSGRSDMRCQACVKSSLCFSDIAQGAISRIKQAINMRDRIHESLLVGAALRGVTAPAGRFHLNSITFSGKGALV